MAGTVSKKRARKAPEGKSARRSTSLDEKRMKELVKEAVREVLEEHADLFEREADAWDKQIQEDALSGRFDRLADQAIADLRNGRATEL